MDEYNDVDLSIQLAKREFDLGNIIEAKMIIVDTIKKVTNKSSLLLCLIELAKIYFVSGDNLKAIQCYIKIYNNSNQQEVMDVIMENFYVPNYNIYKVKYISNASVLEKYQYFYGNINSFTNVVSRPIWNEANDFIYERENKFHEYSNNPFTEVEEFKGKNLLIKNKLNIDDILCYEQLSNKEINFLSMDEPLYLYYDMEFFELALQLLDFEQVVTCKRIIIIVGKEYLKEFFSDYQAILPDFLIDDENRFCVDLISNCIKNKNDYMFNTWMPEIQEYYKYNRDKIVCNIKSGNPKILFITSRFSTIIQYHIRDFNEAARNMDLQTNIVFEKSDLHRTGIDLNYQIYKFQPDIIICIDHFRFEYDSIPENLVWICWTQDPLPHVMSKETPNKLIGRDFILNHYTTWKMFSQIGYPQEKLIDAPVPTNEELYKKYVLTDAEREKYSCDICFVCHASDFLLEVKKLQGMVDDEGIKGVISKASEVYYEMAYKEGGFFYSIEEFEEFLEIIFQEEGYDIAKEGINSLAEHFYLWINQRMFRVILVRWLIEAGCDNIKLWGNGWIEDPEFSKYAMGPARNGEMLSKIYQSSKIVIGNNITTTAAARAWESMLSGTFYLSNYIPPEADATDIRKIMQEDIDFVMFHNREELVKKVKCYLHDEAKREEMAERGRLKALETMTFGSLMKKTLNELKSKL